MKKPRSVEAFSWRIPLFFFLAERVGFEPTDEFPHQLISNQSRYDHFDTAPCRCFCSKNNRKFTLPWTIRTSVFHLDQKGLPAFLQTPELLKNHIKYRAVQIPLRSCIEINSI